MTINVIPRHPPRPVTSLLHVRFWIATFLGACNDSILDAEATIPHHHLPRAMKWLRHLNHCFRICILRATLLIPSPVIAAPVMHPLTTLFFCFYISTISLSDGAQSIISLPAMEIIVTACRHSSARPWLRGVLPILRVPPITHATAARCLEY